MSTHIILVENRKDWQPDYPEAVVVTANDYLSRPEYLKLKGAKIINLCRSYRYLSIGYYCSLLAEARRHKTVPSVRTLTDLSSKAIYSLDAEDLDDMVHRSLRKHAAPPGEGRFELNIFFGQCDDKDLQDLARQIFDAFRCPLLKIEFRLQGKWHISSIKPIYLNTIPPEQRPLFVYAFNAYLNKRWQIPKAKNFGRYDLAILHNPAEKFAPSNLSALHKFIRAGKKLGVNVDLVGKKDYSKLGEYDALFIRETTQIDHHTYRFSKKAESEGMVVIDDPDSIVKCTNKVYLAELLASNKIPTPKTIILRKKGNLKALEGVIDYPVVLKIPDGSFSRGVFKANNAKEVEELTTKLFKESDLLLAQEFVPTSFDWRIGVLNRKPLFACQYFMSKKHWQIVKHDTSSGRFEQGAYKTWQIEEAPKEIVNVAVAAAKLIGDGLYGVDLKQTEKGVVVIEVNDNPNIDAGVEDEHLGGQLYEIIMAEFVRRLDLRKTRDLPRAENGNAYNIAPLNTSAAMRLDEHPAEALFQVRRADDRK